MIVGRRFEKARFDYRFAAAIAASATLMIAVFVTLLYVAVRSTEIEPPRTHCDKLAERAANAPAAEKVGLLQEYDDGWCSYIR